MRQVWSETRRAPNKSLIIGDGLLPWAATYNDVADVLEGYGEVVLNAIMAAELGYEIKPGSVIYNLECLIIRDNGITQMWGFKRDIDYLKLLQSGRYLVWDYQRRNVEYLKSNGVACLHVPFGYHPCLERATKLPKDIDVLFYGTLTERRRKVLYEIYKSVINFSFVSDQACIYGTELDKLISRAKIVVNLHRLDGHPLEVIRLNYLLANNCFVVSERGNDEVESKFYEEGLVFSDYEHIASRCIEYLEKDRESIAAKGREIVRTRPMMGLMSGA